MQKTSPTVHSLPRTWQIILLGFGASLLFWLVESFVLVYVFGEGTLLNQILRPSHHDIWQRSLVFIFVVGFALYAHSLLNKYRQTAVALQASEEKYRNLVEFSPDAIGIQSGDKIVYFNPAGAALFGADDPEELMGLSVWDFVLPEYRDLIEEQYRQLCQENKQSPMIEIRFKRLDGRYGDAEVVAIPYQHDGRLAIQTIFRDITERKKAASELVKLRKAVETSGEIIFLTDREGTITYVNPQFTHVYGYTAEEIVQKTTPRILKSGVLTQKDYEEFWRKLLNKEVVTGEWPNKCKDGHFITIEGAASPVLDEDGQIIGFLAIQRDITERKRIENEVRQRNKELAALNAIAATVSHSLDLEKILNGALTEVLRLDMFGGQAKGMLFRLNEAQGSLELAAHRGAGPCHPCVTNPIRLGECLCGLTAQTGELILCNDCSQDVRHSRIWPEMPDHHDVCLPLKARDKVLGVMNLRLPVNQNVSDYDLQLLEAMADQIGMALENAQLFEAVRQHHERLRQLNVRLSETEEMERRRLACELHDQVGQNLTALGINLKIIQTLAPEDTAVKSRLRESQKLLEKITSQIRGVMTDLRPSILDDYGLPAALRWLGEQFSDRTNIAVTVNAEHSLPAISPLVKNTLFRIAQEALTNVAKHAQADHVAITLESNATNICLTISDNGVGFDRRAVGEPEPDQGWGLLIMTERAEAAGGQCRIDSRAGQGTSIIVEAPL